MKLKKDFSFKGFGVDCKVDINLIRLKILFILTIRLFYEKNIRLMVEFRKVNTTTD